MLANYTTLTSLSIVNCPKLTVITSMTMICQHHTVLTLPLPHLNLRKVRNHSFFDCPSYIHPYTTVKSLSCQEIINIAIAQQCMSKTSKELTVLNYSELTTYILGSKGILAYSATRPLAEKGKDSIIFNYSELTSCILDSKGFLTYSMHWDPV